VCSRDPQLLEICSNVVGEMARDTIDSRDLPLVRTPTDPALAVDSRPAAYPEDNMGASVQIFVSPANLSDSSLLAPGVWNRPRQNSSSTSSSIRSSAPSPATSVFSSLDESVSSITVPDQDEAIQTQNPVHAIRARGVDTEALVIRRACRLTATADATSKPLRFPTTSSPGSTRPSSGNRKVYVSNAQSPTVREQHPHRPESYHPPSSIERFPVWRRCDELRSCTISTRIEWCQKNQMQYDTSNTTTWTS
jgi:hypothetical protein